MIKQLRKYDVQTTPFIATKDWELLNVQHQDLVLLEVASELPVGEDTFSAIDFIDYEFGTPYGLLNTNCNIALEQQNADPVIYEEGVSGSGLFYPTEVKNLTGTYKRLIYNQIKRAFYNNQKNPLQIFGIERFDFQTAETKRYLSNYFRVFNIPQTKFGDKIAEGSVQFVDNTFDDNYTATDDCQGNLIAGPNLFSRFQEIRKIENSYVEGIASATCQAPVVTAPDAPSVLAASANSATSGYLWWTGSATATGYYMWRSDDSGSNWMYIGSTPSQTTSSTDTTLQETSSYSYRVAAYNGIGSSSYSNTASISTPLGP